MADGSNGIRIGVDVGGTFTDIVSISDGTIQVTKTPSTPATPETGVITGIKAHQTDGGFDRSSVGFLAHGTTVATNALLEREWAETALITTDGFRDVLEIGRQVRPDIYDFTATKPEPVVDREHRYEVRERLDERGGVITPIHESDIESVADDIVEADIDSVAVALLFSFENPTHEHRIRDMFDDLGVDVSLSLSSDVFSEIREYERALLTSINAALKPVMDRYIGQLNTDLTDLDISAPLRIMQSNGGTGHIERIRTRPVTTLLSGPAAGVQGAAYIATQCGVDNVITMDMGGTSCDVSLVTDGKPTRSTEMEVGSYPIHLPQIAIHTIGAGGGSIAWIDTGDAIRIGPQSAGATPGPICYGRGGNEPTVTDAQVILGRIDPQQFLPHVTSSDIRRTETAIQERIADPLNLSVTEAAQGIVDIANANMAGALRVVSIEEGHDPRSFGLVAFGGAGPLHATTLARDLDIPQVIIPRTAGVLSALGLLVSDLLYDYSTSMLRPFDTLEPDDLNPIFDDFAADGYSALGDTVNEEDIIIERLLDIRYIGQSYELSIPVPSGDITAETLDSVASHYHTTHNRRYGHSSPEESIELVTVRTRARGQVPPPDLGVGHTDSTLEDAVRSHRKVMFQDTSYQTPIYDRSLLPPQSDFDGPAIVEGTESTVVIRPSQHAAIDDTGNIIVEVS